MKKIFANKKVFIGLMMIALIMAMVVPATLVQATGGNLVVHGSTTVGPIIVAAQTAFEAANPSYHITNITQNGSGAGINDLKAGNGNAVDLAMSSKTISSGDQAFLDSYAIARDAICVIVNNAHVPEDITQLTKAQLKSIYEGGVHNWNEVGSASSATIVPRARILSSGTRASFGDGNMVNMHKPAAPNDVHGDGSPNFDLEEATCGTTDANRLASNETMQSAINNASDAAIGYVGLGFDTGDNIRTINIKNDTDGIYYTPEHMNIYTAHYTLARSLWLVRFDDNGATTPNDVSPDAAAEMALINYMKGNAGQQFVVNEGFLKLVPDQDVVPSGFIDIDDIGEVGNHWNESGTPGWIRADIVGADDGGPDGFVDITDIGEVGNWFGATIVD